MGGIGGSGWGETDRQTRPLPPGMSPGTRDSPWPTTAERRQDPSGSGGGTKGAAPARTPGAGKRVPPTATRSRNSPRAAQPFPGDCSRPVAEPQNPSKVSRGGRCARAPAGRAVRPEDAAERVAGRQPEPGFPPALGGAGGSLGKGASPGTHCSSSGLHYVLQKCRILLHPLLALLLLPLPTDWRRPPSPKHLLWKLPFPGGRRGGGRPGRRRWC